MSNGVMSHKDCLELQAMRNYDPTMSNADLAFIFGISLETTRRVIYGKHANSLGDKTPNPQADYIQSVVAPEVVSLKRGRGRPDEDADIRFWNKVLKQSAADCWLWTAAILADGYGAFSIKGKAYKAHRIVWQMTYGEIPNSAQVVHMCGNRACVNPKHLKLKGKYE